MCNKDNTPSLIDNSGTVSGCPAAAERKMRKIVLLVFFCAALVYFGSIWHRELLAPDETRYALIPSEMINSGNYAVPTLNGLSYYEKPCLGYWLIAASMNLFGENGFGVRFPSALFTLLTGVVVYLLGKRGWDQKTGLPATVLYLSSALVFAVGTYAVLDPSFVFFPVAGTACGFFYHTERNKWKAFLYLVLAGCFIGAGILIKGLLSPVLAVTAVAIFLLIKKEYRKLFAAVLPVLIFMILAALPGALYIHNAAPDFWMEFVKYEHFSRMTTGDGSGDNRSEPFWFYIPILPVGYFPALLFIPAGIAAVRKKWREFFLQDDLALFCLTAVIPWFIFFSASSGKLGTYILPLYPFIALLGGKMLIEITGTQYLKYASKALYWFTAVVGGLLLLFAIWQGLPVIPEKLKLYTASEALIAISGLAIMLIWFNLAARMDDNLPKRKFIYFCIGCGVMIFTANHSFPSKVLKDKDHVRFIRDEVMAYIEPDARVLADGSMAASAAWTLKRKVELFGGVGEFRRCLIRANKKAFQLEDMEKIVADARQRKQQVVVFTRSGSRARKILKTPNRKMIKAGRISAIIYDAE